MKKLDLSDETLLSYIVEGKTGQQIAKLLNVNTSTINRKIKKLELPKDICIKYRPSNKEFSQQELDVLIGGLLGDSWIGYVGKGINPSGSFTHKLEHSEYVDYKYSLIKRLCSEPVIHNKYDKRSDRTYQQRFCKIVTNPLLKDIVEAFYKEGKKVVSKEYIDKLSPLGIAIWFMDDGCKNYSGYNIATDCFTIEDVSLLIEMLKKYDISANMIKSHQIYIKKESCEKFTNLIKEYFPDCMKYKLHKF